MNLKNQFGLNQNSRSHRRGLLQLSLLSTICFNLITALSTPPVLASQPAPMPPATAVEAAKVNPLLAEASATVQTAPAIAANDPLFLDDGGVSAVSDGFDQVTSVSQFTDVKPTDWAFQALQSLVERYGCIVGYPDKTYRGNRALTRYEFAAGLNACLDKIQELIAAATADFVKKEDLEVVKRLQEEFTAELAMLRGRVGALEVRTATLEKQQFSTTTKLSGIAVFSIADLFGADGSKNQPVFQGRVNLNLKTSFSGRDLLYVSMFAGNFPTFPFGGFRTASTTAGGLQVNSPEGTLGASFGGTTDNVLEVKTLGYVFPVGQQVQVSVVGAFTPIYALVPTVSFLDDHESGSGAIGLFGHRNAIYALGATGTGAIVNFQVNKQLLLTGAYLAEGLSAANPGSGLFGGGYTAFGQITWMPSPRFSIATTYTNTYFTSGRFGFNYTGQPLMGTAVANTLAGQTRLPAGISFNPPPVVVDSYGVQASYQVNPRFVISGWFGASYANLIGQGNGTILNYALTFAFPDLGKKGNLLGLVVGAEPYLTGFSGGNPQSFKTDVPFHIEAYYKHQLNDNIAITPGFIVLTAPNQDANNGVNVIGTIRTTFTF